MEVKIKKLREGAKIPAYGTPFSAGADLYACLEEAVSLAPGQSMMIPTGIACELPAGTVGLVYARSGMACKQGLAPANKVGVIDCDYRGEITVCLYNHSGESRTVESGERIAQLVIAPYYTAEFSLSDELSETVRGAGGFGSTGRK